MLEPSDLKYLGFYDVNLGAEFSIGQGLTHRYVGGQLRFLALGHSPSGTRYQLKEFAPPVEFGGRVTSVLDSWPDIWAGKQGQANGKWFGLWWEGNASRLWSTGAIDYPNDTQMMRTGAIALSTLSADGIATAKGLFGLEGIGTRRIHGGVVPVPRWFQEAYGVPAYAVGFGGYTSRVAQGLTPSLGPVLIAMPDPAGLPSDGVFPDSQYVTLMDHGSGVTAKDWYSTGDLVPQGFDRGARTGDYRNFYDGGEFPNRLGAWQSAPDGRGRWVWGDSAYQTGVWIDLPTKHGFVIMPTVHTGNVWYQNSTLNWDQRTAEIQIFDPTDFGRVARKNLQPWNVKPKHILRPEWQASLHSGGKGNSPIRTVAATTYDEQTGRLYARWTSATGTWPNNRDRIFVWQID